MKDRLPTQVLENGAIRYAVYDETGAFLRYEYMLLADEPTEPGTPLNKATLLSDETAAEIWPDEAKRPEDPTVDEALMATSSSLNTMQVGDICFSTRNLEEETGGKFVALDGRTVKANAKLADCYMLQSMIADGKIIPTDFSVSNTGWVNGPDALEVDGCYFWISNPTDSTSYYNFSNFLNMRDKNGVVSRITVDTGRQGIYKLFKFREHLIVVSGKLTYKESNNYVHSLNAYVYSVAGNTATKLRTVNIPLNSSSIRYDIGVSITGLSDDKTCIILIGTGTGNQYYGANDIKVLYSADAFETYGWTAFPNMQVYVPSKFNEYSMINQAVKEYDGRYYLYLVTEAGTTVTAYLFVLTDGYANAKNLLSFTKTNTNADWFVYGEYLYNIEVNNNGAYLYRRKLDGSGSASEMTAMSGKYSYLLGAATRKGTLILFCIGDISYGVLIDLAKNNIIKSPELARFTGHSYTSLSADEDYFIVSDKNASGTPTYYNITSMYYSGTYVYHIPTMRFVYINPHLVSDSFRSVYSNPMFINDNGNVVIIIQNYYDNTYTKLIYEIDLSLRVLPEIDFGYIKVEE